MVVVVLDIIDHDHLTQCDQICRVEFEVRKKMKWPNVMHLKVGRRATRRTAWILLYVSVTDGWPSTTTSDVGLSSLGVLFENLFYNFVGCCGHKLYILVKFA